MTAVRSASLVAFSRSAQVDPAAAYSDALQLFRVAGIVSLMVGVLMVVIVPLALPVVYGGDYRAAVPLAQLLVVAQTAQALGSIMDESLRGQGRPFVGVGSKAVAAFVTGCVGFAAVPVSGVLGIAIAATLGQIAYMAVPLVMLRRVTKERILPCGSDFRLLRNGLQRLIRGYACR